MVSIFSYFSTVYCDQHISSFGMVNKSAEMAMFFGTPCFSHINLNFKFLVPLPFLYQLEYQNSKAL